MKRYWELFSSMIIAERLTNISQRNKHLRKKERKKETQWKEKKREKCLKKKRKRINMRKREYNR